MINYIPLLLGVAVITSRIRTLERVLFIMEKTGSTVVFDATVFVQQPGINHLSNSGLREFAGYCALETFWRCLSKCAKRSAYAL